jgi:hypothetical protein
MTVGNIDAAGCGCSQDPVLAGAQLNQAAAVTGAKLLGGSKELLDASVDQAWFCTLYRLHHTALTARVVAA